MFYYCSGDTWLCGLCANPAEIKLNAPDSRGEESYPLGNKRKVAVGLTNKELRVSTYNSSLKIRSPVHKEIQHEPSPA